MEKLIITVATTGGFHGRHQNPNLPEQPEEIAQAAYECYNEGAAIIHIHARDKDGNATADSILFQEIDEKIRARCNIILQHSTGGGPPHYPQESRTQPLEVNPEMASLNMGTLVRTRHLKGSFALNTREIIEWLATEMLKRNIKPEMEVYNNSMFREVENLINKNLITEPYYINLVMGMAHQGVIEATPKNLMLMLQLLPLNTIFNVSAIGQPQLTMTTLSILLGGMIRVGMEDNIYYKKGELAESNAQLVARSVRLARELGREIATADEAREILRLRPQEKIWHKRGGDRGYIQKAVGIADKATEDNSE